MLRLNNKGGFAVTECTTETIAFTRCKRRKVQADFSGGEITSDAGVFLLSEVDKKLRLTERIAPNLYDPRLKGKCDHSMLDLLRQRVYAIALGYEDLNDHDTLRKDTALQTAVGRDSELSSRSTLCRFKTGSSRTRCGRSVPAWSMCLSNRSTNHPKS